MTVTKTQIIFQPIPEEGSGHIGLGIYPPGTWFGNKAFKVFVGGCGRGEYRTLPLAKAGLEKLAIAACDERIAAAKKTIAHYTAEKARLLTIGLSEVRGPKRLKKRRRTKS